LNKSIKAPSLYDYSLQTSSLEDVLKQESQYLNKHSGQGISLKQMSKSIDYAYQPDFYNQNENHTGYSKL